MKLTGRSGSRTPNQKEKHFVVLFLLQVSVALGKQYPSPDVIFQYGSTSYGSFSSYQSNPYYSNPNYLFPAQVEVLNNPNATIYPLQAANLTFFGDFYASPTSGLLLTLPQPLPLTNKPSTNVSGKCLYPNLVQLLRPGANEVTSFSTMFQVLLSLGHPSRGYSGTLQGLAFIITSDNSTPGDAGGYRDWLDFRSTNGTFAVELDYPQTSVLGAESLPATQSFTPPGVCVTVSLNNRTVASNQSLSDSFQIDQFYFYSDQLSVWIEYNGSSETLEVYVSNSTGGGMAFETKPQKPVITTMVDLTPVISQGGMFVGFAGSLSNVTFPVNDIVSDACSNYNDVTFGVGYVINEWTFNSDGSPPDVQRDSNGYPIYLERDQSYYGKSQKDSRTLIASITVPCAVVFLSLIYAIVTLRRRNSRLNALAKKYKIDPEELESLDLGPQNFKYSVLSRATKGFSSNELLGSGGFGKVYRGKLRLSRGTSKRADVAVKRISATSSQGPQEFLAEVKVIGQAQHRNLVRLLGWCHDKGELLLVYDYMPNGSVDQHLFKKKGECSIEDQAILTWARRLKIVSGVATALAFLHEEWEQRVIHRDVKSSNVMLDSDFNARLGDFGLARLSEHDQAPRSTAVLAGTHGYLAPELSHTLKATEKTDVYSFGVVVLEVATGKRPLLPFQDRRTTDEFLMVDWVWGLYQDGNLLEAADCSIEGAYDPREMVTLLKIGLLCCHPNPDERPNMRAFLNIWKGLSPFPHLPYSKPVPVFVWYSTSSALDKDTDDTSVVTTEIYANSGSSTFGREGDTTYMIRMEDYPGRSSITRSGVVGRSGGLCRSFSRGFKRSFSAPTLNSRHWQSTPFPI